MCPYSITTELQMGVKHSISADEAMQYSQLLATNR